MLYNIALQNDNKREEIIYKMIKNESAPTLKGVMHSPTDIVLWKLFVKEAEIDSAVIFELTLRDR